jgi:hypothetical protein
LRRRKGKNTEGRRKNLYVDAWEEDKGWNTDMFMPPDLMQFQVAADTLRKFDVESHPREVCHLFQPRQFKEDGQMHLFLRTGSLCRESDYVAGPYQAIFRAT